MNIFEFESYGKFMIAITRNEIDRGSKGRLAKAAGCNPSWMTRVLADEVHLTPDQALGITQYLQLNESETDYFMGLVELERAATPALCERIRKKLKSLKKEARNFGPLVKTDAALNREQQTRYYSSWIYSALHVSCMLPHSSLKEIASRLGISPKTVNQVLMLLEEMGLITNRDGQWQSTSKNIHLDSTELLAFSGHRNWREKTIQHLQTLNLQGLHYSSVHALSIEDMEVVRTRLKDAVLDCRKVIDDSPPETLGVLCLDWYGL